MDADLIAALEQAQIVADTLLHGVSFAVTRADGATARLDPRDVYLSADAIEAGEHRGDEQ